MKSRAAYSAINSLNVKVPFVVRLVGTNEEEGRRLLAEANMITASSLADAAQKAVAAAKGGNA
jgi:succinyl-CoA synthetase beta subunit